MMDSTKSGSSNSPEVQDTKQTLDKGQSIGNRLGLSIMLEENGPAPFLRTALVFGFGIIIAFVIWAQFAKIDEVAVTSGKVVPSGAVQILQHIDGGTINEIDVSEGEIVKKGQVLVRLDPTDLKAEIKKASTQLVILRMKIARLEAFTNNTDLEFAEVDNRFQPFLKEQKALLEAQRLDLKNQRTILISQIEQRKSEKSFLTKQQSILSKQIAPLEEQLSIRKRLLKNSTLSRFDYLESEREYLKEQGRLEEISLKTVSVDQAITEARGRLSEVVDRSIRDALDEMASTNAEAAEMEENLSKLRSKLYRLDIYSPVEGVVQGLDVKSIGNVIAPGSTILTVVPIGQELILEVHIRPEDIGHLELDQPATVKFATYNYSRYGSVKGKLIHISATTFEDEQGNPFYKGKIKLSKSYVGDNPERNLILPGMTATADIQSGEKTVMEYLLKPIHTTIGQSFRER
ncbi:MAG: HlyD family type I secretion periplasmic adaptor subunit [Proteobacteria bacterium]|nr:HlyD family type I secretion periplasmic adaptor subunit [Pseudomonadota bacterium]